MNKMNQAKTEVRIGRMSATERIREVLEQQCRMKITEIRPSRYSEETNQLEVVTPFTYGSTIRELEKNHINVLQITGESSDSICLIVEVTKLR